jgi:outer membrane protein OmpA-like peptidoglycan-associated protein
LIKLSHDKWNHSINNSPALFTINKGNTLKFIALLAVLLVQVAHSDTFDYSKKFGIGASFGYNTPVFGNIFNHAADGGESWGVHARYHLCASCGIEAAFTKQEFNDTNSALQVTDVLFFKRLKPMERFTPVFGAGLGVVDITHYDPNSLKLGLKLRAGAEYALNQAFSLGLNVDYQNVNKMFFGDNLPGRNINTLAARLGLTWYFGGADSAASPAAAPMAAKATDKDSDNDGVMDSKDKCPSTAEGVAVNAYGCAEKEKAEVHLNVQFAVGKTSIAPGYDSDLKELAAFMAEHPKTKIEIQGHTDNSGSKAINKRLSEARARAVKTHLVNELKVDASRVDAKGYGDEKPVASNDTPEGKQQNRRVVAIIE